MLKEKLCQKKNCGKRVAMNASFSSKKTPGAVIL